MTEEEKYTTLDTEQCKWWVNTLFSMAKEKACNSHNFDDAEEMQSAQDKILKALEQNEELQKENEDFQEYIDKANHTNSQLIQLIEKHKMNRDTCDDCVSRKSLLDKLDPLYKEKIKTAPGNMAEGFMQVSNLIKYEPPVTPTRKVGKWVLLDECANSGYYCSECHKKLVKEGWSNTVKKINFCPNCGASFE